MGIGGPKKIADTEFIEDPADYVLKNFDKSDNATCERVGGVLRCSD